VTLLAVIAALYAIGLIFGTGLALARNQWCWIFLLVPVFMIAWGVELLNSSNPGDETRGIGLYLGIMATLVMVLVFGVAQVIGLGWLRAIKKAVRRSPDRQSTAPRSD
jgi:hypothetical protein